VQGSKNPEAYSPDYVKVFQHENDADAGSSFAAAEWNDGDRLLR